MPHRRLTEKTGSILGGESGLSFPLSLSRGSLPRPYSNQLYIRILANQSKFLHSNSTFFSPVGEIWIFIYTAITIVLILNKYYLLLIITTG